MVWQRLGHIHKQEIRIGNIEQDILAVQIIMRMRRGVGVVQRSRAIKTNPTQQAGLGELVQSVVDGRR